MDLVVLSLTARAAASAAPDMTDDARAYEDAEGRLHVLRLSDAEP